MNIYYKLQSIREKVTFKFKKSWCTKWSLVALVILGILYFLAEAYQLSFTEVKRNLRIPEGNPYLIDTPACRIPNLQAKSAEAMKYIFDKDPIDCGNPPLVESNDTHLQIVFSALPKYGINDPKSISCCYRPMWRHVPNINVKPKDMNASWIFDGKIYDNDIRYRKECIPFGDSVEINYDFVRVECEANTTIIYKDYHGFVPTPKPVHSHLHQSADVRSVNVVIIGIDSLSRLNMIRKMPKTYDYLENVLQAMPMYGYNKVGVNTFPNVVPLLTGYSVEELQFCWANYTAKFDLCPFIWNAFNYRGYATAFIEDTAWMGLFIYTKYGFVKQPTQYDSRPLLYAGESEAGHNKGLNAYYCIGPRSQIQIVVEYTHKLLRRLHHFKQKHFVYSWGTSFSHDYLNEPQLADSHYLNLLQQSHNDGLLNDTILFFMSDHGLRFGSFLSTDQGQLEGSLPALFLVVPKWFQEQYPKAMINLKTNQRRLLTTFDIHQTLNDLMDLRSLTPEYLHVREEVLRKKTTSYKGISLFLALPEERDCETAGVPAEFCACRKLDKISVESPILAKVVLVAVGELNAKLHGSPECVPLVLKNITRASYEEAAYRQDGAELYQVSFYTEPGEGLFLASVLHFPQNDTFQLIGDVSRLNAYGNQSYCVPDSKLRPICFCVSQDEDAR